MAAKKNKIEKVSKPYLKGDVFDRTTLPGALKFFAGTIGMAVGFLLVCLMMNWEQQWLNVTVNLAIALVIYMLFAQFGMNSGADAVNQGEIMFAREEKGRPVADWERKLCYHPFKGLLSALIGSVPLVLCSVVLACIAQRQMTGLGALPSWVSGYESRPEIGNALVIYHETAGLTLETVLRLIVRMATMPFVNMVGADNKDAMLLLERLSPLVNLLPAIAYGLGYMNGVSVRSSVHTNIALGKKKAKRKQAKERRARRQAHGPEQLN
ncbi:MAG: hypothetical protein ACI4WX_16295 [Aristaeellaceae bacterium]